MKAQAKILTSLIMVIIFAGIVFGLYWGATHGADEKILDSFLWLNVKFSELSPDVDDEVLPGSQIIFEQKDLKIIDAEDISCERFVNFGVDDGFDLLDCPEIIDKGKDYCDPISIACLMQHKDEFNSACQYRTNCDVESEEWKTNYVAQQIGILIERCLDITDESTKRSVTCFEFEYTGADSRMSLDTVKEVARYSESYYTLQEIIQLDQGYDIEVVAQIDTIFGDTPTQIWWHEDTTGTGEDERAMYIEPDESYRNLVCEEVCDTLTGQTLEDAWCNYKCEGFSDCGDFDCPIQQITKMS
jgi:hypothetical protein